MYSFIVFKYVNLILWKEKYILGRIGLYFWGFGEKLNYFLRIWGAKEKYLQGAEEFGEINALFSGIKGAQTPWGPQYYFCYALMCLADDTFSRSLTKWWG